MKLILWETELKLPSLKTLEERKTVVDDILATYPNNFKYTGLSDNDRKVQVRLDILGTYLLNAVKDIRQDVMSQYKIKNRPRQEKNFSALKRDELSGIKVNIASYRDRDELSYNFGE